MRYATLVLLGLVVWSATPAPASAAAGIPGPWMNLHPPRPCIHPYWCPGPYMIWGPTDRIWPVLCPVNGIGAPPFVPKVLYKDNCCPTPPARWWRSPRDYFMDSSRGSRDYFGR